MANKLPDGVVPLPRGGLLLETSQGYIQYGAVAETIKDTLGTPAGVPSVFVAPARLFAPDRGINLAELEFPAYWHYFIKGRKVSIVCRPEQRALITRILREAAFGPAALDPREFSGTLPPGTPDLMRETASFKRNKATGTSFTLEDLVDFVEFGADGKAHLPGGVDLALDGDALVVVEGGKARVKVDGDPPVPPQVERRMAGKHAFRAPVFGVTVIGSGHGFDPGNRTSGFIVWLGGRGVMVDPPVDALDWLAQYDVDPKCVDGLILTHCHADHDAGALQKLLQEGRVTIYTTHTVLGSFVEKYSLLTGMDPAQFRKLFDHVPVRSNEPINLHGAQVTFRYSLHSVPCVGFEIEMRGKGLVYPSDTLNHPPAIRELQDEGILGDARARDLLAFPWHHQLVIHEAGIPPIHTPVDYLASLDDDVKRRMLLVHVSSKSLPADSGLAVAPTGLEHTIDLKVPEMPVEEALEALDAMARVDILAELPAARAADFLRCVKKERFKKGACVVAQGTPGDRFYTIIKGHASVVQDGKELKVYNDYDYFGETALITGAPRVADVFAKTDLVVLSMHRLDFLHMLRGTDLPARLEHLAKLRELPSWELLTASPIFCHLSANQKNQIQQFMDPIELAAGTAIADHIVVATGRVTVTKDGAKINDIGRGGFAGDPARLRSRRASPYAFVCATKVTGYRLRKKPLVTFFEKNPGVYVHLSNLEAHPPTGSKAAARRPGSSEA
jgi:phosphoribosyl 1,2-cyclic phosphodiesterase